MEHTCQTDNLFKLIKIIKHLNFSDQQIPENLSSNTNEFQKSETNKAGAGPSQSDHTQTKRDAAAAAAAAARRHSPAPKTIRNHHRHRGGGSTGPARRSDHGHLLPVARLAHALHRRDNSGLAVLQVVAASADHG
jgi:hypothetical protein